jgi:Na+-transporting NADH:ubiquinone oxidoreductase subunit D
MAVKKTKNINNPLILFLSKNSEPIIFKKNKHLLSDPLDDNNPITVQVLGSLFCTWLLPFN